MLDKQKLNADRMSLYTDIDKAITDLVDARLSHDTQKEVDALHMMETLMVQTQQFLDCMGVMFEEKPEEGLEKAADAYVEDNPPYLPDDGVHDREIEEAYETAKSTFVASADWQREQMTPKYDGNLEEEILKTKKEYLVDNPHVIGDITGKDIEEIAHRFADWQKEQLLKTADDYIIDDDKTVMGFYRCGGLVYKPVVFGAAPEGINVGDKVKVIIIKQ